ncbi:hypothetical protein JKP88DRAFT_164356 [Tribonema minus]|uniref:NrS-1 polymerase-like helicase domain-containing protein n=1 Tax=Tribonema minus TaxID=303371 RepID=A0A835YWC3_9STRA|nr:hypothetical protein JKP88DRAFT_164356 [Tribonema minus]
MRASKGKDDEETFWLNDEKILTYEACRFVPPPNECPDTVYNSWSGFLVEKYTATEEDNHLLDTHVLPFIKEIICNNYQPAAIYLINWLAQLFQYPGAKTRTAIVLLGEEGVGKSKFTHLIEYMLGIGLHYRTTDLQNDCFGRFSNIAENRVMAFFEELEPKKVNAFYNKLMDLITSMSSRCEQKGIGHAFNISDFLRVIITTNAEHNLLRIRSKDRKFQYISASNARQNDAEYFGKLSDIIKRPGVQRAFYDYLM